MSGGCLVVAIMSKAAVNTHAQVFFCVCVCERKSPSPGINAYECNCVLFVFNLKKFFGHAVQYVGS